MHIKKYDNGDSYFGQLESNHKQGVGVFYSPGASVYIGEFRRSNTAGVGVLIDSKRRLFADKDQKEYFEKFHNTPFEYFIFKEFTPNQVYGFMKLEKTVYKGYFDSSVQFGSGEPVTGTLIKETTHYIAKGVFGPAGLDGVGEFLSNQEHYMGYFSEGHKHGLGYTKRLDKRQNSIARWANGAETGTAIDWFQSEVVIRVRMDERVQGYLKYKNGDMYLGDLKEVAAEDSDGEEVGRRPDNPQDSQAIDDAGLIRTRFKRYIKHGFGTLYKANTDYYTGGWEFDQRSGIGLETIFEPPGKDGDQLERAQYYGHFGNNKRHGYGRLTYADGTMFEGLFSRDLLNSTVRVTPGSTTAGSRVPKYFLYHEQNKIGESTPDKISEFRKMEAAQTLFDRDDFKTYSLRKQGQLESLLNQRKNELIHEFAQMSSILKYNYELFKGIDAETTLHFERRQRLTKAVLDIRMLLFKKCNDGFFSIVLKDPVQSLKMFQKSDEDVPKVEQTLQKGLFRMDQSDGQELLGGSNQKDSFVRNFLHLIEKKPAQMRAQSPLATIGQWNLPRRDSEDRRKDRSKSNVKAQFEKEFPSYFTKLMEKNIRATPARESGAQPSPGRLARKELKSRSMVAEPMSRTAANPNPPQNSFVGATLSQKALPNADAVTRLAQCEADSMSQFTINTRLAGVVKEVYEPKSPKPSALKMTSAKPRLDPGAVLEDMRRQIELNKAPKREDPGAGLLSGFEKDEQPIRVDPRRQSLSDPTLPNGLISLDNIEIDDKVPTLFPSKHKGDTKMDIDEARQSLAMQFMSND